MSDSNQDSVDIDLDGQENENGHEDETIRHETGYDSLNESSEIDQTVEHNSITSHSNDNTEDPELEAIRARVREMEEEAEKLKQMQDEAEKQISLSPQGTTGLTLDEKMEVDARSIHVGNVDYSATADDLERHFHGCGSINRVTILCDRFSGHPKGFAYIEFAEKDAAQTAMALDDSLFKGRQIKVNPKRTNTPGISSTNRPPRGLGRGFRRGAYMGRAAPWMYSRASRRARRGWYYSPY